MSLTLQGVIVVYSLDTVSKCIPKMVKSMLRVCVGRMDVYTHTHTHTHTRTYTHTHMYMFIHTHTGIAIELEIDTDVGMGWLRLVGFFKS